MNFSFEINVEQRESFPKEKPQLDLSCSNTSKNLNIGGFCYFCFLYEAYVTFLYGNLNVLV